MATGTAFARDVEITRLLAELYTETGDKPRAIAYGKHLVELLPGDAHAQKYLEELQAQGAGTGRASP